MTYSPVRLGSRRKQMLLGLGRACTASCDVVRKRNTWLREVNILQGFALVEREEERTEMVMN